MDKSFEQFSVWWKTASRTLMCDTYEAFEIWQEAQKSVKQNEKTYTAPDGWILVPKEPTERMLDASRRRQWDQLSLPMEDMDMLKYKAMLEAVVVKEGGDVQGW